MALGVYDIVARSLSHDQKILFPHPRELAETVVALLFDPSPPPLAESERRNRFEERGPRGIHHLKENMDNSHVHLVRPAWMNAVLALRGATRTHPPPGSPIGQRHLASRARERQPGQAIQLDPIPRLAPRLLRPMREPDAAAADAMDGALVVPDVLLVVPAAARQFAGFSVPVPGPSAHVCAVAFRTGGFAGLQVVGGFRVREAALLGTRLLGDGVKIRFFSFFFLSISLVERGSPTHMANLGGTDPALGFAAVFAGVDP